MLKLRLSGNSTKDIGVYCGISARTVEARFDRLREEHGAKDLLHLVGILISKNLL